MYRERDNIDILLCVLSSRSFVLARHWARHETAGKGGKVWTVQDKSAAAQSSRMWSVCIYIYIYIYIHTYIHIIYYIYIYVYV